VAVDEAPVARDNVQAARPGQPGEPVREPPDGGLGPRPHPPEVERRRRELEACLPGGPRGVDEGGQAEERLGGDAAHVEALAAEGPARLDEHGVETEVGGPERRRVPAGAAPEDDQIGVAGQLPHHH
jgi:hypothetical protein